MARKSKDPKEIKLAHPSRAEPTEKTLLQWAEERNLFAQARQREREKGGSPGAADTESTGANKKMKRWDAKTGKEAPEGEGGGSGEEDAGDVITPGQERVLEAILWAFTISSVHFMLDVLVQNQYAVDIMWRNVVVRTGQAFLVFLLLLYPLHPHYSSPAPIPLLPRRYQHLFRQALFLLSGTAAGCYLIHLTNTSGHLAVMKRAPTLGCLWVWAVVEMDLALSVFSVAVAGGFLFLGGYDFK